MRIREILRATAGTAVLAAALLVPMATSAETNAGGSVNISANNEDTILLTVTNSTVSFGNVGPDGDGGGTADATGATYCRTGPSITYASNVGGVGLSYSVTSTGNSTTLGASDVSFNLASAGCGAGGALALGTGGGPWTIPNNLIVGPPQNVATNAFLRVDWTDDPGSFALALQITLATS